MRLLSIDLPWSASAGHFGFAWVDLAQNRPASTAVVAGGASCAAPIFVNFARQNGHFDLVLIDKPIGPGRAGTGYRPVERACGNSSFVTNNGTRIQGPRFQPGAAYVASGFTIAQSASVLGRQSTVFVESFPQLSILPMIGFLIQRQQPHNALDRVAAHKQGRAASDAARQLVAGFRAWTNRAVTGPATSGQPDAIDALLALLPAFEVLAPSSGRYAPCWLCCQPPGPPPLPSAAVRALRPGVRAQWVSPMIRGQLGSPGIRVDGILSLEQPGWLAAAAPRRVL